LARILELLKTGPISGFRLRTKLLLLALTTLALPWAGCQYAREMETVLRESEQQSLLAVTTTIAGSLKGRKELLFRADSLPGNGGERDITPMVLTGAPLIDGRADDWDTDARSLVRAVGPGGDSLRLLAATHERWLYLALLVRDTRWIFDASDLNALDPGTLGDRVWLAFDDKRGGQQRLFFGSTGPGPVRARRIETLEYGRESAVEEPRIEGAWQRAADGWVVLADEVNFTGEGDEHVGLGDNTGTAGEKLVFDAVRVTNLDAPTPDDMDGDSGGCAAGGAGAGLGALGALALVLRRRRLRT
jgi:hypothetical protein